MRFETDDENLSIELRLETEPQDLDLTADLLGERILDHAEAEMLAGLDAERDPKGRAWAPLRPSTVRAKGHTTIGIETGAMRLEMGEAERLVEPRLAIWSWTKFGVTFPRAHAFHNGRPGRQAPRPLIGWTQDARDFATQAIRDAQAED